MGYVTTPDGDELLALSLGRLTTSSSSCSPGTRRPFDLKMRSVKALGAEIIILVSVVGQTNERIREDISEAAAEIPADFPEAAKIHECYEITDAPIPYERRPERRMGVPQIQRAKKQTTRYQRQKRPARPLLIRS
jgi:hypothetical protein